MFRTARVLVASLLVGAGLAGCASSGVSGEKRAVECDKCGMTVRKPYTVPSYEGPREVGYFATKTPECASCREAADAYAATGKIAEPACKTCGGTMKVAEKK